jgi:hypothetical protein
MTAFLIAVNGGNGISAVRWRVKPKMTLFFKFFTLIWYKSALSFSRLSLTVQNFFDLHAKCHMKFVGKGYSLRKNNFNDETASRPFLGSAVRSVEQCKKKER